MKSLQEYSERISTANPGELVVILTDLTTDYAKVCDMLIPIKRAKIKFWLDNKKLSSEKPVSDKTLEMMWMAEEGDLNGEIQERMEMYKKAIQTISSNVKAILREKEHEAKNQY